MAPFKLRFSKLSKSRSKGSRSSSTECDDALQQIQHCSNSRPETPAIECNSITPINELGTFPNSPPPSYEHVLQETKLKRTASGEENEEDDEQNEREEEHNEINNECNEINCNERRNLTENCDGRCGDGGGPGGGCCEVRRIETKGPEIFHKSSKQLYRAVAKQWGLTCKMSDQCRCFDCQSHYFDSEYDKDQMDKSDGGLGAGTPMFIAEVMHGTACVLL